MRDDFPKPVLETLAKRVGNRCSNPACRKRTSGPHTEDDKALNVGVAAHITAASPVAHGTTRRSRRRNERASATASGSVSPVPSWWTTTRRGTRRSCSSDGRRTPSRKRCGRSSPLPATEARPTSTLSRSTALEFDRAALQDSLRSCGSYKKFAQALNDLISLLNTGTIQERHVDQTPGRLRQP